MNTTTEQLSHPDSEDAIEVLEARIAPAFSSPIDLGTMGSDTGSSISGDAAADRSGFSVSDAGDVNGDGIADFIIGAYTASPNGTSQAGAAYVVFGTSSGFGANFNLADVNGANGFKLNGTAVSERVGWSVAGAGDLNGDGYDDVIVGARGGDSAPGTSYVVFGSGSAFPASINLSALNGTNGFKVVGAAAGDLAGYAVSGIGDFNHDGYDDVAIAGPGDSGQTGRAFVVFGKATGWTASLNLSSLNGSNGFRMDGQAASDNFGFSVAGAGDFNRDGIPDLIIGANAVDVGAIQNVGASYVIFGKAGTYPATFNVASLNGSNGFKVIGAAEGEGIGASVAGISDINGDGFSDIAIGAYRSEPHGAWSGATYVIFGASSMASGTMAVTALNGANGFKISGEGFSDFTGWDVKGAGDVNGDGFNDIAIGAPRAGTYGKILCGYGYVVFGHANPYATDFQLSSVDGSNGFSLIGANANDYAGVSISGVGDVNGDGFDDLIIGAYQADPAGHSRAGTSYVIYGKQSINADVASTGKTASFNGPDGLRITVSVSKGSLSSNNLILKGLPGGGAELLRLDLSDSMFQGATVKITSAPGGSTMAKTHTKTSPRDGVSVPHIGTGFMNIGFLDAQGVDLGKVTIDGDVGRIVAGDSDLGTAAFTSLTVNSWGMNGTRLLTLDDQGPSEITGTIKTLKILTDVRDVQLDVDSIKTLTIGGSVEHLDVFATSLGTVKITGSVNESLFQLSGLSAPANAKAATVLQSFTVSGSFVHSDIFGGYNAKGEAVNADVAIGTVQVNGNWVASQLVLGVRSGDDGLFGDQTDSLIPGGNGAIIAKIAKLIIKGDALGTYDDGDQYGIVAEQFGSATIGKTKLQLTKNAAEAYIIADTADLFFREVVA